MRGEKTSRIAAVAMGFMAAAFLFIGCKTTVYSGLPRHINTVEVHIFQNKTMYKSVEAYLTRDIIDRINADPRLRVSSRGGDALLTGEITKIRHQTMRETTTNEPGTVRIVIEAHYSFYDQVKGKYIKEEAVITSADMSIASGIYEASRGGTSEAGERAAAKALAGEIVRRTVGMW